MRIKERLNEALERKEERKKRRRRRRHRREEKPTWMGKKKYKGREGKRRK